MFELKKFARIIRLGKNSHTKDEGSAETAPPAEDSTKPFSARDAAHLMGVFFQKQESARSRRFWKRVGIAALFVGIAALFFDGSGRNEKVSMYSSTLAVVSGVDAGLGTGKVVVIKMESVVDGDPLGEPTAANTVRYLDEAFAAALKESSLAGITLYINSPGGSASSSAWVYRNCKRFRAKHPEVPVVAYVSDGAYSGAYYLALCAEKIIVDKEANVANIGVIMHALNIHDIGANWGVHEDTYKTGPNKDALNRWKQSNQGDREMIERGIQASFERFLAAVSESRKIPLETLRKEATENGSRTSGAWFASEDALALGLVDEVVDYQDYFEQKGPVFAEKKKFAKIEYVEYGAQKGLRQTIISGVKEVARAIAGGIAEALREEAARTRGQVRAQ